MGLIQHTHWTDTHHGLPHTARHALDPHDERRLERYRDAGAAVLSLLLDLLLVSSIVFAIWWGVSHALG